MKVQFTPRSCVPPELQTVAPTAQSVTQEGQTVTPMEHTSLLLFFSPSLFLFSYLKSLLSGP